MQELKDYLRQGIQLDELWRVARGEIKLRDFEASASPGNGAALAEAPEAPPVDIPQDLVRLVARPSAMRLDVSRHRLLPDGSTSVAGDRCPPPWPSLSFIIRLCLYSAGLDCEQAGGCGLPNTLSL